jgi:rare lipoprotein A
MILFLLLTFLADGAPLVVHNNSTTIGFASYYSSKFEGNVTASGRIYDSTKLTAAHRTFRFGTRLRVTNLRNHRSTIVTVTDRGPHNKRRLVDLSYAAAYKLRMLRSGVVPVRVEVLDK